MPFLCLSYLAAMKSGGMLRLSSLLSAATVITVAAAVTAISSPAAATGENDDDQQNDPAAITAPTVIVPTAHKTHLINYLTTNKGCSVVMQSILCADHPSGSG